MLVIFGLAKKPKLSIYNWLVEKVCQIKCSQYAHIKDTHKQTQTYTQHTFMYVELGKYKLTDCNCNVQLKKFFPRNLNLKSIFSRRIKSS